MFLTFTIVFVESMMLEIARVKAISLDLDDTLWPIWPTIERAEKVLHNWLVEHAPMAAALFSSPSALREIRDYMAANRPDLKNDLSAVRRESIRLALCSAPARTRCWPSRPSRPSLPNGSG